MSLTYEKVVRGLSLLLFTVSIILSFFNPSTILVLTGALSLSLFGIFEVSEHFKNKDKEKTLDYESIRNRMDELEKGFDDIKGDHSLAHLAATFKRK